MKIASWDFSYLFFLFTKCTDLNGDIPGLQAYIDKMASMVILVFSMVKGSIPEIEFILISRGKKLNSRPFFLLHVSFI